MARKSKRMIAAEQAAPLSSYIYNVAVYVRLSIEDKYYKNGTDSLSTQEEMALEYLKDKADMKLYKVIRITAKQAQILNGKAFKI